MKDSKHTPASGAQLDEQDGRIFITRTDDDGFNWALAEVLTSAPDYSSTARLMVAAPELLEVCKGFLDMFGDNPYAIETYSDGAQAEADFQRLVKKARTALARVEREEVPA